MFEIGKEYNRKSEIHEKYKGQSQGGISTPKDFPGIFIFTSDAGEQHGYRDEYRDDGIFWYTGEGQIGDMKMEAGNKAILEHAKSKKIIYVFEYTRKAHVRFLGTADCLDYHQEIRPDRNGQDRTVIVFHLDIDSVPEKNQTSEPKAAYRSNNLKALKSKSIKELRDAALRKAAPGSSAREKKKPHIIALKHLNFM